MFLSNDETTRAPLRLWLVGYGVQCVVHMVCVCVCVEYKRRREASGARVRVSSSMSIGSGIGSNLNLNVNSESNLDSRSNSSLNSSSSGSLDGDFVEFVPESRQDDENTRLVPGVGNMRIIGRLRLTLHKTVVLEMTTIFSELWPCGCVS